MQEVKIELVKPGTRLAKAVTKPDGSVLLEPGTELTATVITQLQRIGLKSLHIDEQKSPQQSEMEVMRRFRKVAEDPIQRQICAAVLHSHRLRDQRRQAKG